MNIRFTSSLTPEDENTLAPALIETIASVLELLPIAYMIRIDTSDSHVYQHVRADSPLPLKESLGGVRLDELRGLPS